MQQVHHCGGRNVGEYIIVCELGTAKLSRYFLVVHDVKGTKHTMRVMDKALLSQSCDIRSLFYNELKALRFHDHPSIASLCDVIEDEHRVYIVTAFIEGPRFLHIARKWGEVSEIDARRMFHQVVNIAMFLSRNGINHLFRLENLVWVGDGRIILVDYLGLEERHETRHRDITRVQYLHYRAPELVKEVWFTSKGNAWACGVALYVLLVRRLPFDNGGSEEALKTQICNGQARIPHEVSMTAKLLLLRLLDKNVGSRFDLTDITEDSWFKTGLFGWDENSFFMQSSANISSRPFHVGNSSMSSEYGAADNLSAKYGQHGVGNAAGSANHSPLPSIRRRENRVLRLPSALQSIQLPRQVPNARPLSISSIDEEHMLATQRTMAEEATMALIGRSRRSSRRRFAYRSMDTFRATVDSREDRWRQQDRGWEEEGLEKKRWEWRWSLRIRSPISIRR